MSDLKRFVSIANLDVQRPLAKRIANYRNDMTWREKQLALLDPIRNMSPMLMIMIIELMSGAIGICLFFLAGIDMLHGTVATSLLLVTIGSPAIWWIGRLERRHAQWLKDTEELRNVAELLDAWQKFANAGGLDDDRGPLASEQKFIESTGECVRFIATTIPLYIGRNGDRSFEVLIYSLQDRDQALIVVGRLSDLTDKLIAFDEAQLRRALSEVADIDGHHQRAKPKERVSNS